MVNHNLGCRHTWACTTIQGKRIYKFDIDRNQPFRVVKQGQSVSFFELLQSVQVVELGQFRPSRSTESIMYPSTSSSWINQSETSNQVNPPKSSAIRLSHIFLRVLGPLLYNGPVCLLSPIRVSGRSSWWSRMRVRKNNYVKIDNLLQF